MLLVNQFDFDFKMSEINNVNIAIAIDESNMVKKEKEENETPKMEAQEVQSKDEPMEEEAEENPNGNIKTGKAKKRKGSVLPQNAKKNKSYVQPKNALMQLNELRPGLAYTFEPAQGPQHQPIFVVSVEVNGEKFVGQGNSKQSAKHAAAFAALSSFIQLENMPSTMQTQPSTMDFTEDNIENEAPILETNTSVLSANSISPHKFNKKLQKILSLTSKQNPVVLLNEIHPGIEYVLVQENTNNPGHRFVMSVRIKDEVFEASGPSKKLAKADAARLALAKCYNVQLYGSCPIVSMPNVMDKELFDFPQEAANTIAKCVNNTFNDVMIGNEDYLKWKVLAGIVMTKGQEMDDVQVIGVGTGTKHLNGEYMSMNGAVINDCHAEVIARRCLKDFFYTQLELHVEGQGDTSIFEKNPDGMFNLRPNIRFHLFISTSPCGDARIFSVHQDEDGTNVDLHPNRKARGLLRTKIESGEGTIPVRNGQNVMTWDGIIQGSQRYLTMSCSDKIACWNVLGLQGALLAQFVEPIYLHSIILGRLLHSDHMYRAMCGRFMSTLGELPNPYSLHKPKMSSTSSLEVRELTKSPNYSINWTIGLGRPEVVIAKTGKCLDGTLSRLSKRSLFERFSTLYTHLKDNKTSPQTRFYSAMKQTNVAYVNAKRELVKSFALAGLGSWVNKPVEEGEFQLSF